MKLLWILIFLVSFYTPKHLQAILDGRTGNFPIDVDVTYSFSNFEWARGYVSFQKGFDLPPGGTILLGIDQSISGTINLNGGTIILEKSITLKRDASFTDSGYFKTNNNTIFFSGDLNLTETYHFSDKITLNGMGTGIATASPSSRIISRNSNRLALKNLTLNLLGETSNFIFTTTGERFYDIESTSLYTTGTVMIERLKAVTGECFLNGYNALFMADIVDNIQANLFVNFGTRLETSRLSTSAAYASTYLDSVALSIKNSGFPFPGLLGLGTILIDGKCTLDSKNTTPIGIFGSSLDIIIRSNARLIMQPNTHLKL